ncbi:MAG TPA: metallophosphoesterase [Anaerolineae bacterium]|nr:metallophosphoesterase [Anaerolineae bacterium]
MHETTIQKKAVDVSDPVVDVLEEGLTHKVMLVFHVPAQWPAWVMALLAALASGLLGMAWWQLAADLRLGVVVTAVMFIFLLSDMLLLKSLPGQQISFGPWQSQTVALAVPRLLAALAAGILTVWLDSRWGLGLFLAVELLGTAALLWGAIIEPFRLQMNELMVYSDRLPSGSEPIRLLHITDLHVERLTQREENVLALAKKAKPDLILITGDYVNLSYNRDPETLAQVRQLLLRLSAVAEVYATLGSPPVDLRETVVPVFDGLPVTLMRQAWQDVDFGDGRHLILLGMDCTHHLPTDEARLHHLAKDAPHNAPQVLLYHSPELMPEAMEYGLDLYLCGHTHGGQVRLPVIGPILTSSQLGRQFAMGLYKYGRTHLYVSRGVGLEGLSAPRVRFLCPPEITLVTLYAKGGGN